MTKTSQDELETLRERNEITELIGKLSTGKVDKESVKNLVSTMRRSLRVSRRGVTLSGHGIADLLALAAPKIPVRDLETLRAAHDGMTDAALAGQVVRKASRASAAVGGATGALASAHAFAPPLWIMLPAEVVAETLVVAAIEIRMVAELHNVYGTPISGDQQERSAALLQAWAERRGVSVSELGDEKAMTKALGKGKGGNGRIVSMVKRKLMARLFRNVSSLAPLFVGAVAGATLNRRSTKELGNVVVRDLASKKRKWK